MEDQDRGAGKICQAAQIEENILHGGDAVFGGAHEIGEGIDNDQVGTQREGSVGEDFGILAGAHVVHC